MRIGVIDSGIGGLSTILEINKTFKGNSYYYICDSLNFPYGNKPYKTLKKIINNNVSILLYYDIDILVIACNTASTLMLNSLKNTYNMDIIGVLPSVDIANSGKTLLMATKNTINVLKDSLKENNVVPLIMADLAEKIENIAPDFNKVEREITSILQEYNYCDNIILGCTHYVFLKDMVKKLSPTINIYNGNDIVIEKIRALTNFKSNYAFKSARIHFIDTKYSDINYIKVKKLVQGSGIKIIKEW